jgi:hypothetical protein
VIGRVVPHPNGHPLLELSDRGELNLLTQASLERATTVPRGDAERQINQRREVLLSGE